MKVPSWWDYRSGEPDWWLIGTGGCLGMMIILAILALVLLIDPMAACPAG